MDIYKIYDVFAKLNASPQLIRQIRRLFLKMILKSGVRSRKEIRKEAIEKAQQSFAQLGYQETNRINKDLWIQTVNDFEGMIIDQYLIKYFPEREIDDAIRFVSNKNEVEQLNQILRLDRIPDATLLSQLTHFIQQNENEFDLTQEEVEGIRVKLISYFISNQLAYSGIAKTYLSINAISQIINNTVGGETGTGLIGGKAAGLFLSNQILKASSDFEPNDEISLMVQDIKIPTTYIINTRVFEEFVAYNQFSELHHIKYKSMDDIRRHKPVIHRLLRHAKFSPYLENQIKKILKELPDTPLILRSSSLLEDSFGTQFSGKYASIFIANQGPICDRVSDFMDALKQVFESVFDVNPILYRRKHDLIDFDEHMAVIVQPVVGKFYKHYYFPFIGGVGFSANQYTWSSRLNKKDGLLRFVFGLGTRAVDRVGDDYPRMVSLTEPTLRPEIQVQDIMKYSQRYMDLINLKTRTLETKNVYEILPEIKDELNELSLLISSIKPDYVDHYYSGDELPPHYCLTFDGLLTYNPFAKILKRTLKTLEAAYKRPVDIEYAYNENTLYVLQCRPLSQYKSKYQGHIPSDIPFDRILFTANKHLISSDIRNVEYIVYVDHEWYIRLEENYDKLMVARVIGKINQALYNKRFILMGPGRWGSQNIHLGVKVTYADINNCKALIEIARMKGGYTNEVSFGTHFFQDLVEDDIVPIPLYPDESSIHFNFEFLMRSKNILRQVTEGYEHLEHVIRLIHVPSELDGSYLRIVLDGVQQQGIGYFETGVTENEWSND